MAKAGIDLTSVVGARGANLEGVVPDKVNWKAHNYAHLMEQPTLFYATVIILGVIGQGDGLNLQLAWAYVILRIAHQLRWCIKAHGLRIQQRAGEDRRMMAFQP